MADAPAPMMPAPGTAEEQPRARATRSESLSTIAWRQFRRHPLARVSLTVLGVLYLFAAFADFIAPYPERYINSQATFQPPNRVRFWNEEGFTRPYFYPLEQTLDFDTLQTTLTADENNPVPLAFFVHREGVRDRYFPFPVNLIPSGVRQTLGLRPWATLHLFGSSDPNVPFYLWGADDLGGDVFGKILFGARISLTIGILASAVAIVFGMVLGGLAGFFGGWVDEVIMRLAEALSAIPDIFLLLTLAAIFYPLNLSPTVVFLLIVSALSLIGWGGVARTVRGQVLSLRERDFTYAARSLGAGNSRIIFKHLLPHTLSFIIVYGSISIPSFILTESVLSFYGLGIQPPSTSWGLMLSTAQKFVGVSGLASRWWIFLPGVFIFIAVLTWNLLGDGLRDAFDPRSRQ